MVDAVVVWFGAVSQYDYRNSFSVGGCFTLFFFFKQKTAYEMRISDWSSDVCSSDLVRRAGGAVSPASPNKRLSSSSSGISSFAAIAPRDSPSFQDRKSVV